MEIIIEEMFVFKIHAVKLGRKNKSGRLFFHLLEMPLRNKLVNKDVNAYPNNEETVSDEIDLSSIRQEIPVNNTNMSMLVKKKFFQLKFF